MSSTRAKVKKILKVIAMLGGLLAIGFGGYALYRQAPRVTGYNNLPHIWQNNRAVEMQTQKKKSESFDEFADLLAKEPFNPLFQYNMSTGFILMEDAGKATTMLEKLAQAPQLSPHLAFATHYNLGVLKSLAKDIDGAIDSYQAALEYNPTSREVKTNIELLIQQKKAGGGGDGEPPPDENQQSEGEEGRQPQEPERVHNQPQQFNSKEMSQEDLRSILEELKNQEQQIRAKHEREGGKQSEKDKNW